MSFHTPQDSGLLFPNPQLSAISITNSSKQANKQKNSLQKKSRQYFDNFQFLNIKPWNRFPGYLFSLKQCIRQSKVLPKNTGKYKQNTGAWLFLRKVFWSLIYCFIAIEKLWRISKLLKYSSEYTWRKLSNWWCEKCSVKNKKTTKKKHMGNFRKKKLEVWE